MKYLLIINFLIIFNSIKSQTNENIITKIVCDSITKEPIFFLTVSVINKKTDKIEKGTITDTSGIFYLKQKNIQDYYIELSHLNYKTRIIRNINSYKDDTIFLSLNTEILESVTINASRIVKDIDKLVMNVNKIVMPQNSSCYDLLKKAPGSYLSTKDNISIIGQDVLILLNGKKTNIPNNILLKQLKGRSYKDISKIEIMFTTPPEYADEWDGAVINIITKKQLSNGIYGVSSLNLKQGNLYSSEGFISLNYRTQTTNYYLMLDAQTKNKKYEKKINQINILNDSLIAYQEILTKDNQNPITITSSISYKFNKNNRIDLGYDGSFTFDKTNTADKTMLNSNNVLSFVNNNNNTSMNNFNLFYSKKFNRKGHLFLIESNYYTYYLSNTQENEYFYHFIKDSTEINSYDINSKSNNYQANIKYYFPFKKYKIKCGIKWNITNINNSFEQQMIINNELSSNIFNYNEQTLKSFLSIGRQLKNNLGIKIALRYINTSINTLQINNNNKYNTSYNYILPNLYFNKSINKAHEITITWDRTINQPKYKSYNPYKYYYSKSYFIEGNQYIKPELKNKLSLLYSINYKFFTKLTYSYISDYITLEPIINNNNIVGNKYSNIDKYTFSKISLLYYPSPILNNKVNLSFKTNINFTSVENNSNNYFNSDYNFSLFFDIDYIFNTKKNWSFGFYNNYTSGIINGYNNLKNYNKCGLSIIFNFLKNNLNIMFDINDLFNSEHNNYYTEIENIKYNYTKIPDSRYYRLTLTYKFNKKQIKEYNVHKSINEEKNRF